jgi:hypothetical protein
VRGLKIPGRQGANFWVAPAPLLSPFYNCLLRILELPENPEQWYINMRRVVFVELGLSLYLDSLSQWHKPWPELTDPRQAVPRSSQSVGELRLARDIRPANQIELIMDD